MRHFEVSIQKLLQLDDPLPASLRNELQVGHHLLSNIDEDFKLLCSEMRIWTFSETKDSKLSGGGISGSPDVPFTAPITSLKSAILGVRHEKIYTLQSTHADCASFGMANIQTLKLYLKDLGDAIRKAQSTHAKNSAKYSLGLEEVVQIEVHGFYEDIVATSTDIPAIRAFSSIQTLASFMENGPDELLEKRLNEIDIPAQSSPAGPRREQFRRTRTRSPRIVSEGPISPSDQASQRRNRRQSVASIFSKSGRDQSPAPQSPIRLERGDMTAPGMMAEASKLGTLESDSTGLVPAQSSSLHPGYFPSFHPDMLGYQSTNGTDAPVAEASSTEPVQSPMAMEQNNEETVEQNLYSQVPTVMNRRGSESVFSQDLRASLSKPDRRARKFVWIHVPYTNPFWVTKVFNTLQVKEARDFSELFGPENWSSRHARGRHSQHHACFVKSACGYVPQRPSSELGSPGYVSPRHRPPILSHGCVYLYFPFLHFDTYRNLIKRRNMIKERLSQGRSRPIPESVANNDSLEHRMIWEFLGHDPPINCRRTLDQYRYPSLHDTSARDDDQMLYKMTKERIDLGDYGVSERFVQGQDIDGSSYSNRRTGHDDEVPNETELDEHRGGSDADSEVADSEEEDLKPEDDILDGNVLMVDQIWLWVIDKSKDSPFG